MSIIYEIYTFFLVRILKTNFDHYSHYSETYLPRVKKPSLEAVTGENYVDNFQK